MKDETTEDKILEAANKIFTEKGYAEARVRDIAEQAGVNLALINYYYRSKENLFSIVMRKKVQQLFGTIIPYMMDESTDLKEKMNNILNEAIKVVSSDRNLPMFVFGELQKQDMGFATLIPGEMIKNSSLLKQIKEKCPDINPLNFIMNFTSMIFFPYIISPMMIKVGIVSDREVVTILNERKQLIPKWIAKMLDM